LLTAESNQRTPDLASKNLGYRGYLTTLVDSVDVSPVAYQNANDFWLETGTFNFHSFEVNWIRNEASSKPDNSPSHWGGVYSFGPAVSAYAKGSSDRRVDDPHESMAFVARSRTGPLGSEPEEFNPTPPGFKSLDLAKMYKFRAARADHSGQFQRDIQYMYEDGDGKLWTTSFYSQLMTDLGVAPNQ
jgi:hypothetical protein